MSITIAAERPDSDDARHLIDELEAHLAQFYPPESRHGFAVDTLLRQGVHFFVVRWDGEAAGCCGIHFVRARVGKGRPEPGYGEIKRMYVRPTFRGRGLGSAMLRHLTAHAQENSVQVLRLETGIHQTRALRLYEEHGFRRIPPFGPYADDPLSLCYEMVLP